MHECYEIHGVRVLACESEGPALRNNRDLNDLISAAWENRAQMLMVPVARLGDEFFHLKTGVAGEIVQKILQYQLRLAIVGDISRYVEESTALRDFVRESNRGNQLCFVADKSELASRLDSKSA